MIKEEIQQKIDHYAAVAEAYKRVEGIGFHYGFYMGKRDAWVNIWKENYPDEDRAYPFDEKAFEIDVKNQSTYICA